MANKVKVITGAVIAAIVASVAVTWVCGGFERGDPAVREIKKLAESPPSQSSREAMRDAIEQRTEGMSDEQRQTFFREKLAPLFMPMMAKRFAEDYDRLMAMSPEERRNELDRRIDQMQKWQKMRGPPRGPRGAGPQISPQEINEMRAKMLDWITPDQRGKMENGMRLMQERMKERGIQSPGGFF